MAAIFPIKARRSEAVASGANGFGGDARFMGDIKKSPKEEAFASGANGFEGDARFMGDIKKSPKEEAFAGGGEQIPSYGGSHADSGAGSQAVASPERLLALSRQGDAHATDELIGGCTALVRAIASRFYCPHLTVEDWYQEGMLALIGAMRTYDFSSSAQFRTYACACIKNRLCSLLRHESAKSSLAAQEQPLQFSEPSAEDALIAKESYGAFKSVFSQALSPTEQSALMLYTAGFSYDETAKKLGISRKSVDNALYRAKQKLKKSFSP